MEVEDLIEESTNLIISSTGTLIQNLESSLAGQIDEVNGRVVVAESTITGSLSTLSSGVFDQFSQVQMSLGSVGSSLSSQLANTQTALSGAIADLSTDINSVGVGSIATTVNTISADVTTLASALDGLPAAVQSIGSTVGDISTDLDALSALLDAVPSSIGDLAGSVSSVASAVGSLSGNMDGQFANVNAQLGGLSSSLSNGFAGASTTTSNLQSTANNILTEVAEVKAKVSLLSNSFHAIYFEKFLLASATTLVEIPWKYRTPAVAGGSMNDILDFLLSTYDSKLEDCESLSTAFCINLRQTATPAFASLQSDFNTQVAQGKYKKAFQILQGFYVKLFPTANWV